MIIFTVFLSPVDDVITHIVRVDQTAVVSTV